MFNLLPITFLQLRCVLKQLFFFLVFINSDVDIEAQFTLNQSRAEEITMREDFGNITLVPHDDGFGDMGAFDGDHTDLMRSPHPLEPSLEQVLFRRTGFLCLTVGLKRPQLVFSSYVLS